MADRNYGKKNSASAPLLTTRPLIQNKEKKIKNQVI